MGQAELLSIVMAQEFWGALLRGRRALVFVGNNAARHAIIRGASQSGPSASLVQHFWAAESELGAYSWFERVPSLSNPADGPSRLCFGGLVAPGARVRGAEEVLSLVCVRRAASGQ